MDAETRRYQSLKTDYLEALEKVKEALLKIDALGAARNAAMDDVRKTAVPEITELGRIVELKAAVVRDVELDVQRELDALPDKTSQEDREKHLSRLGRPVAELLEAKKTLNDRVAVSKAALDEIQSSFEEQLAEAKSAIEAAQKAADKISRSMRAMNEK